MRTISSREGIIPLLVERDQAEAVAERIGEHRQLAIRSLAGLAFLHGPGGDGALDRRLDVLDREVGMDRAPMAAVAPGVAAGRADRCPGFFPEQVDRRVGAEQLDEIRIEAPADLEPERFGVESYARLD